MKKLSKDLIRGIRKKPWYINEKNLNLDQTIIEEAVKNLKLTRCPVCKGNLKREDNFDVNLPFDSQYFVEKYCPKDNYIIRLDAHKYAGNTYGTALSMKIFTNSRHSKLIADSGKLADISQHVDLCPF